MSNPIPVLNVDVSKLELRKPKKENTKNATGKSYHVYHGDDKLAVILPEMTAPFGAGNSAKFPDRYTVSLSFENRAKTLEKMKAIDEKILELILAKRAELFPKDTKSKKPVPTEVLKSRYKSFIVPGDETKGYADRMSLSVQRKKAPEDTPEDKRADLEKEFVTMNGGDLLVTPEGTTVHVTTDNIRDNVPFGSRIRAVAEFAYLWVLASSQECYPVWTFVLGVLASTTPVSKFTYQQLLNQDDGEEETVATRNPSHDDLAADSLEDDALNTTKAAASEIPVYMDEEEAHLAAAAL